MWIRLESSEIDIVSKTDDVSVTQKTIEKTSETAGKTKYTKKVATIDKMTASTEYNSVVASNGVVIGEYTKCAAHAERTTRTIDYTNTTMSKDKVAKISYAEKLNNASSAQEIQQIKRNHTWSNIEKGIKTTSNITKDLTSGGGKMVVRSSLT